MARSCITDPRWRELVAQYRYDWIAAADVMFGKPPPGSRTRSLSLRRSLAAKRLYRLVTVRVSRI